MNSPQESSEFDLTRLKKVFIYFCIVISAIILIDTLFLGQNRTEEITGLNEEYQSYFNAAGNGHSTFKVNTTNYAFYLSPESVEALSLNVQINLKTSSIFNQPLYVINPDTSKEIVLLSGFTGLTIPAVVILFMLLALKFKNRLGIITFVLQVALLINLAYLIQ